MLIHKTNVRKYLLEKADARIKGKFTRVKPEVLLEADAQLRKWADEFVRNHPTVGKTLSMG